MSNIIRAIERKAELDKLRPLSVADEQRIMQKFRLDWNYHSNHLEGNTLTYGETKALVLFGLTAQGKPLKDHLEIEGHNEAILWIIDVIKEDRPLNEQFIRSLHQLILKENYFVDAITADGQPTRKEIHVGKYKTTPNHVKTKKGEIFHFATPEETPAKMNELIDWYIAESERDDIEPILLASEFHYRFVRIHPFDDGNGRTARLLMNFILMKFGYPPVIIKTEDKGNYFNVLQLADAGQFEQFAEYIAQNLIHSLTLMIKGAKGESIEEEDDLKKELSLLKSKLDSLNSNHKLDQNGITQYKRDIVKKFLFKIHRLLCEENKNFLKFYSGTSAFIEIDKLGVGGVAFVNTRRYEIKEDNLNLFEKVSDKINKESPNCLIEYFFTQKFNENNFNPISYNMAFYVHFKQNSFDLILNNGEITNNFPYGYIFSDSEVEELIKYQSDKHLKKIKSELDNFHNN